MDEIIKEFDLEHYVNLEDNEFLEVFGTIPEGSESEGEGDVSENEIEKIEKYIDQNQESNAIKLVKQIEENYKELQSLEDEGYDLVEKEENVSSGPAEAPSTSGRGTSGPLVPTCGHGSRSGLSRDIEPAVPSTSAEVNRSRLRKVRKTYVTPPTTTREPSEVSPTERDPESSAEPSRECPIPSASGAVSRSRLTSKKNWKFSKTKFNPPDTQWLGSIPDPPTEEMTPYEYFEMFFSNNVFDLICEQSNMYCIQSNGKILNATKQEHKKFVGIWLHMGIVAMPSMRQYWSRECRYPPIADTISQNRFFELLKFFHLADNQKMPKPGNDNYDRLYKVRPLLSAISETLSKIPPEEYNSVDEQIIPYKGRYALRQYVKNKPHKWGYKVFTRAGESGIMYAFKIYIGKDTC